MCSLPIIVSGDPVSTLTGVLGAFYPSLTPALGPMTYTPRCSEGTEGTGCQSVVSQGW